MIAKLALRAKWFQGEMVLEVTGRNGIIMLRANGFQGEMVLLPAGRNGNMCLRARWYNVPQGEMVFLAED